MMIGSQIASAATGAALALLMAGCSNPTPQPGPSGTAGSTAATPSASASSQSPSPSATSTLSAKQQEAKDQAVAAVLAFSQTWVDLYTGSRTRLNDLNDVLAAGPLLDVSLKRVQQDLASGVRSKPKGAQVELVSADLVSVKLNKEPPTVVIRACVDSSAAKTTFPDGSTRPGAREEVEYTVVKTDYLPDPGWAVASMAGPKDPKERRC